MFSTIESDITKSGQALSIFGKELQNVYHDFNSAIHGIKTKTGNISQFSIGRILGNKLSQQDIDSIRRYNDEIRKYNEMTDDAVTPQTAFYKCLGNSSSAAQKLARDANGAAISEETLKAASQTSTVALKAQSIAMNLLGNVAITAIIIGISKIVKGFVDLVNHVEITKKKVEDLKSTFQSALDTANSNAKRVEELADRYDKLSKGVNNLGENVSLTNEEYKEYNSLVNEIADMFPTLVQGYTDEGNAIINLKNNVEDLRDAYKEAQQEAYNLLIVNGQDSDGNDILKQWQNLKDTGFLANLFDFGMADVNKGISVTDAIEQLKAIQNMTAERYREIERIAGQGTTKEISTLSEIEKDIAYGSYLNKALGLTWDISDEDFINAKKQAKVLVQTYNAEVETALADVKTLANAYLMTNEDYAELDSQSKKIASILTNGLNFDIADNFKTKEDVGVYVDGILTTIKTSEPEIQSVFNKLLAVDTDNLPVSEAKKQVDDYIQELSDYLGIDANQLKISFGYEFVDDNANELQNVLNRAKEKFNLKLDWTEVVEGEHSVITKEQIALLAECIDATDSMTKALELYDEKVREVANTTDTVFNYAIYSKQVDDIVKNVDKVQSALDSLNSGKSLSTKDIAELADAFPSYSAKILSAANDTEKLKSVLSDVKRDVPQSLISTLKNLKNLSQEDQTAVNGLISILTQFNNSVSTFTDTLADLDTKESLLSSTYKEMHDDGQISLGTYQKLISLGEEYANLVSIVDGQMTVNVQSLKELTQKKYEDEIATLRLTKAELGYNIASNPKDANKYYEQIQAINDEIEAKEKALGLLNGYDYTAGVKEDKPQSVLDFEAEYARRQHEINMGRMKEDEDYYKWLESAAKTAFEGLKDYQDDLWKYEEEVYNGRKKLAEDFYDSQRDYYKDRVSDLEAQIEITTKDSTDNNGNLLNAEEKFAYIRSVYSDILATIQEDINDIVQNGIEGHEDDLKALEQQYEKYVREMADIFKDEVESEIDYIQYLQDTAEKAFDDKIDKIEAEKKAMEDRYDAEIDKIDSVIDSLEKENDQKQLALDIAKAEKELAEAQRKRNVGVLQANGTISYQADPEAIAEAQNNLNELYQERITEALKEQKELLQKNKEIESDNYDAKIDNLNTEKDKWKDFYDDLVDTLNEYLNPKQTESNTNVWNTVAGENGVVKVGKVEMSTDQIDARIGSDEIAKSLMEKFIKASNDEVKAKELIENLDLDNAYSILSGNSLKPAGLAELQKSGMFNSVSAQNYVNNNGQTVNLSIGDIYIQEPVGDSTNLAQELMKKLPNAITQQIYKVR